MRAAAKENAKTLAGFTAQLNNEDARFKQCAHRPPPFFYLPIF